MDVILGVPGPNQGPEAIKEFGQLRKGRAMISQGLTPKWRETQLPKASLMPVSLRKQYETSISTRVFHPKVANAFYMLFIPFLGRS